ncbi:nucleotidyltransferase [Desulfuribacillus alkaliarsenatis]|uniref:tRNA(Met) cytidine acetate ligase n=1 Tax=Desulfuribacillus alkaliarsenatis TaxID=766136 RepID=A0A1E5G5U8_9FIRM|nr:nucleotidyltransferase [Desulfuribacillus alkaliarsenatis]OEF98552.1 hypothetical protein BHF68_02495 [Desulfuribacillus alkaliarsenatis]
MNATGIIVEYNPFHNGHAYHIEKSKQATNADTLVAVMSGNFLQRGEPAITDKWTRADMALRAGVDIVLELPTVYATQNAQVFAYGAISILHQLGCVNSICFGSESGSIDALDKISSILLNESKDFKHSIKQQMQSGVSYPKAMEAALLAEYPDLESNIRLQANNTLGLMYMLALKQLESSITPYTIKRTAADYHATTITDKAIASATAIRKLIETETFDAIAPYVPGVTLDILRTTYKDILTLDDFRNMLFSKLYPLKASDLQCYVDIDKGLATRITKYCKNAPTVSSLISQIKCKNYTWTRIQRALIHILLNMMKKDLEQLKPAQYARVLGFNAKGQTFLQQAKKSSSIPIITNWGRESFLYSDYDITATRIYSLIEQQRRKNEISMSGLVNRDFTLPPIRF